MPATGESPSHFQPLKMWPKFIIIGEELPHNQEQLYLLKYIEQQLVNPFLLSGLQICCQHCHIYRLLFPWRI
jgi:hypothetical protein